VRVDRLGWLPLPPAQYADGAPERMISGNWPLLQEEEEEVDDVLKPAMVMDDGCKLL
jgi:hypothetical protein